MIRYTVLAAATLLATHLHAEQSHFLCKADEQLVFGCSLGEKQVSVCASSTLTADTGYVQYRFGTAQRLEQAYPRQLVPPAGRFFLSTTSYAGGGASALRFRIDGSDHFLFDRTRRTSFTADEPHDAEFLAGLVIQEGAELSEAPSTTLLCDENDASVRKVAYDHFPREAYKLEGLP